MEFYYKAGNEFRLYKSELKDDYTLINLYAKNNEDDPYILRDCVFLNYSIKYDSSDLGLSICKDESTTNDYLIYTNGAKGIYALELNPRNGLAHIEGEGTLLASRPTLYGFSINNPIMIYSSEMNYYYLFSTYGKFGIDSNIRVGRSQSIKGPFLDANNVLLTNKSDFTSSTGFMILAPFSIEQGETYTSFSLKNIASDENNIYTMSCNTSDLSGDFFDKEFKLTFTPDKWPVIIPDTYNEESFIIKSAITPEDIIGNYDFISFNKEIIGSRKASVMLSILDLVTPGVSSTRNSWALDIAPIAMGRIELGGSIRGYWRLVDKTTLELSYSNYNEIYTLNVCDNITLTGKNSNGIACFARKILA